MRIDGITLREGSSVANLTVASGNEAAMNAVATPNAGELFFRTDVTQLWAYSGSAWAAVGGGGASGVDSVAGNTGVVTAGQLLTAITSVDGTASGLDADLLDGLNSTAFAAASHNHTTSDVTDWPVAVSMVEVGYLDGVTSALQTQLGTKAPTSSPALTGTPTAPTAAAYTNTTQLASTSFVIENSCTSSKATPTISANALTLDLSVAGLFEVSLNANITTLTISNPPTNAVAHGFALKLNITGSFTVTWPASVKWPSGTAPTLTSTNGKVDSFVFYTVDGGTTYLGFVAGQNA